MIRINQRLSRKPLMMNRDVKKERNGENEVNEHDERGEGHCFS